MLKEGEELSAVLTYAFGEHDIRSLSWGGLESHPRITDGVLYRSSDSHTAMRQARELLLSLAPGGFYISLSSCYNYTQPEFSEGDCPARRHHAHVEGLNAQISLSLPPRTGAQKFVVDLHWSTANMANQDGDAVTIIISKDAKAVIPTDMSPVQRYSRSWSKRMVLPDHTYDQSRVNCYDVLVHQSNKKDCQRF